jgi:hypothetical protein
MKLGYGPGRGGQLSMSAIAWLQQSSSFSRIDLRVCTEPGVASTSGITAKAGRDRLSGHGVSERRVCRRACFADGTVRKI